MNDVDETISNIIVAQLAVESSSITPDTKLENIGPDPFKMADFIVSVEEAFGIDIPDEDFDRLSTVGDLIVRAQSHRKALELRLVCARRGCSSLSRSTERCAR
jgi:acyl carrier protein